MTGRTPGDRKPGTKTPAAKALGGKAPAGKAPGSKTPGLRAPDASLPFSRPVAVSEMPPQGLELAIEANEAERAALARDYGLPSLSRLTATFRLAGRGRTVHVQGEVQAELEQTCVVSLEPFPVSVVEPVEVRYSEDAGPPDDEVVELSEQALDAPEPLVNGLVDLGALAAEFLALGLDPYPRKPDAAFDFEGGEAEDASPFAALAGLKGKQKPDPA
jgi:hypothetical protein